MLVEQTSLNNFCQSNNAPNNLPGEYLIAKQYLELNKRNILLIILIHDNLKIHFTRSRET